MGLSIKQRMTLRKTESIIRKLGKQLNIGMIERDFKLSDFKSLDYKHNICEYKNILGGWGTDVLKPIINVGKFEFEFDAIPHGAHQQQIMIRVDDILIAEKGLDYNSLFYFKHRLPEQMLVELCEALTILKEVYEKVKYDNKHCKTTKQLELEKEREVLIQKFTK